MFQVRLSAHISVACLLMALALSAAAQTLRFGTFVETDVSFTSTDPVIQDVYNAADELETTLIMQRGDYRVLVEGGWYWDCWIETQPMGGAMYAKNDLEVALNNQMIFIDFQHADGRMPAHVPDGTSGSYNKIQGYCFPTPAWNMYWHIGKDTAYLDTLYQALERCDNWLWTNRDQDGDHVLEAAGTGDMGEDDAIRYDGVSTPVENVDMMGYSYDGRTTLAKIAAELGNGQSALWRSKADSVKATLAAELWDPARHACYDRDNDDVVLNTLVHNNIRGMYHGVFTQQMADEFVRYHLLNRDEFWTPLPLVSVAVNDPLFRNFSGNNWSGQPEGLTYQRTVDALANYGHHAEIALVGEKLFQAVYPTCRFPQQWDPFTMLPNDAPSNYGPAQLALLEYVARMYGVELVRDTLHWSCLARGSETQEYTSTWGSNTYRVRTEGGNASGYLNGSLLFTCTSGIRVVTTLSGDLVKVIGTDTVSSLDVSLSIGGSSYQATVAPNEVLEPSGASLVSVAQIPFDRDPGVPVDKPWGPVIADRWSDRSIRVHWREMFAGQTGFDVQRANDSAFTQGVVTFAAPAAAHWFVDTTVVTGNRYYYRARANGPVGSSGWSYVSGATAQIGYLSDFDQYIARCYSNTAYKRDEPHNGGTITLDGATFPKGIGAHAPSRVTFDLGSMYGRFQAEVGVDDAAGDNGSVEFFVYLDGSTDPVFQSGLMTGASARQQVDIDVAGHDTLILVATDGGDDIGWDHAVWADARLLSDGATRVAQAPVEMALRAAPPSIRCRGRDVVVEAPASVPCEVLLVDMNGRVVLRTKRQGPFRFVLPADRLGHGVRAVVVRQEGPAPKRVVRMVSM